MVLLAVDGDVFSLVLEVSRVVLVNASLQHSMKAGSHGMPRLNFLNTQLLPLEPVKIPCDVRKKKKTFIVSLYIYFFILGSGL